MNLRHSSLQVTLAPGTGALQSIGWTKPSSICPLICSHLTMSSSFSSPSPCPPFP